MIFDLDGTLVDSAPDIFRATNRALHRFGLQSIEADRLRPKVGYGARAILTRALEEQGGAAEKARLDELEATLLDDYVANIAVESLPFPGVMDALEELARRGAVLSVCTNKTTVMAETLLNALDMARLFKAICGRDAFAFSKPHPGHITSTIARSGGDERRAVMIGDSEADVDAARAAGIPAVVMSYGYSARDPRELGADLVLDTMAVLPVALTSLLSAAD
ncbi:HAD-IA family hydrolase [Consotaella salsifontis]|uniref:phosphoglycolate phosphatase n=1 Tax=Consotaella salsifontis TaxID=1365950 RepID=A0A1T4MJV3_9HYPH|nr:HAD-IA family hydrolase [Consotaella salsifontis]SJZ67034.1 phosphoglycolate phosphatase [Consotaella salsifontis]